MKTLPRNLLLIELPVCFAPAVVFLAIGIFMLPIWVGMLGAAIFKAEYRSALSGIEGFVVVASILAVIGGLIGLLGLARVMRLLLKTEPPAAVSGRTRLYSFIGVATPILLAIVFFWRDIRALVFLSVLPIAASLHIIYLARNAFFPTKRRLRRPHNTSLERTREG
jgi:hypothetical protein